MNRRNALSLFLVLCAGLANGTMDSLQFHFPRTPFADAARFDRMFWDPAVSWKNKYAGGDPARGERFPLSTTALVFVTDGWHLAKFCMLKAFLLALLAFQGVVPPESPLGGARIFGLYLGWFLALQAAFAVGFALTYC